MSQAVHVIGGGLAGSEAAWQLAKRGIPVDLYEMRPVKKTPAHATPNLAELVCSNSLGSDLPNRAPGLLKSELRRMDSMVLQVAEETKLPAGGALAVDRDKFSALVTQRIEDHPLITLKRQEMTTVPAGPSIIASGPLTSDALTTQLKTLSGTKYLYFYDALSPIVSADSINMDVAFRANRYQRGQREDGDYINCPFTQDGYLAFVTALLEAEKITLKPFEEADMKENFFEMCLPVEELARRGERALAFGPMRPVGIRDPRTDKRPYAVLQLRQDNVAGSLYNLVGFQTNLRWGEQKRVFRMIPGLEKAEFLRYGMMHRNTYINAPTLLKPTMQWHNRPDLFFAGQIVGVEGYVGNIGSGLIAGINLARLLQDRPLLTLPKTTMLGALNHYVTHAEPDDFQPMKANFGLMPALHPPVKNKRLRYEAYFNRALTDLDTYLTQMEELAPA